MRTLSVRRIARTGSLAAGIALIGLTFTAVRTQADSPAYTVTNLGTLGGCMSVAKALNNRGDIVGFSLNATEPMERPFIYRDGVTTAISDSFGWATGINDAGQVTGFVSLPDDPNVDAFLYQDGVLTDLGGLPGYSNQPYSVGYAINNAGTIARRRLGTVRCLDNSSLDSPIGPLAATASMCP